MQNHLLPIHFGIAPSILESAMVLAKCATQTKGRLAMSEACYRNQHSEEATTYGEPPKKVVRVASGFCRDGGCWTPQGCAPGHCAGKPYYRP